MSYSCADFVDTVLDALGLGMDVPLQHSDDPSFQADMALSAIARLKACATALRRDNRAAYDQACADAAVECPPPVPYDDDEMEP